jgi:2-desacetyl-2-hydroxyethyl bacteriochlorophyllide A dehydrogenase
LKTAAIVFTKKSEAQLRSIDMPDPGRDEVQVRTLYSTISSGTEGWILQDRFSWQPTTFPCVPGYQRVGVITRIGPGVAGWKEGDKVFATVGNWKGTVAPQWGAHLAVGNTLASEIYRLPDGSPGDIEMSLGVVAQVGYNAAHRASLKSGDWVVVYGDGLIGHCAAQVARSREARVILVGHRRERLALALKNSADHVIDNRGNSVAAAVRNLTAGKPVAVVLDSVQTEEAQMEYEGLLDPGIGQIVYCGFTPGKSWADMGSLQRRQLTTHFVSGWIRPRLESTLELIARGGMSMRPLITHLVSFEKGPQMYEMILNKSEPFMGITFNWKDAT